MTFIDWLNKDAKWWHFWLPQSGLLGGLLLGIAGKVVFGVIYIFAAILL